LYHHFIRIHDFLIVMKELPMGALRPSLLKWVYSYVFRFSPHPYSKDTPRSRSFWRIYWTR